MTTNLEGMAIIFAIDGSFTLKKYCFWFTSRTQIHHGREETICYTVSLEINAPKQCAIGTSLCYGCILLAQTHLNEDIRTEEYLTKVIMILIRFFFFYSHLASFLLAVRRKSFISWICLGCK